MDGTVVSHSTSHHRSSCNLSQSLFLRRISPWLHPAGALLLQQAVLVELLWSNILWSMSGGGNGARVCLLQGGNSAETLSLLEATREETWGNVNRYCVLRNRVIQLLREKVLSTLSRYVNRHWVLRNRVAQY
jgi:hypothetical protein